MSTAKRARVYTTQSGLLMDPVLVLVSQFLDTPTRVTLATLSIKTAFASNYRTQELNQILINRVEQALEGGKPIEWYWKAPRTMVYFREPKKPTCAEIVIMAPYSSKDGESVHVHPSNFPKMKSLEVHSGNHVCLSDDFGTLESINTTISGRVYIESFPPLSTLLLTSLSTFSLTTYYGDLEGLFGSLAESSPRLCKLKIGDIRSNFVSCAPLQDLQELRELHLPGTQVKNIDKLSPLLEVLNVRGFHQCDLSSLQTTRLTKLVTDESDPRLLDGLEKQKDLMSLCL